MKRINQHSKKSSFYQELTNVMNGKPDTGRYDYLRIILSKTECQIGQLFLMVTSSGFGLVRLVDLNIRNNQIHMDFLDFSTGMFNHIAFDAEDSDFKFLLISWQDIQNMNPAISEDEENIQETFFD